MAETLMRASDRILVLGPLSNKVEVSKLGNLDPGLLSGKNKLHAIKDPQTCMWSMKYDNGVLPEPLKQKFTNFKMLSDHVNNYFKKRNIKITEVLD